MGARGLHLGFKHYRDAYSLNLDELDPVSFAAVLPHVLARKGSQFACSFCFEGSCAFAVGSAGRLRGKPNTALGIVLLPQSRARLGSAVALECHVGWISFLA